LTKISKSTYLFLWSTAGLRLWRSKSTDIQISRKLKIFANNAQKLYFNWDQQCTKCQFQFLKLTLFFAWVGAIWFRRNNGTHIYQWNLTNITSMENEWKRCNHIYLFVPSWNWNINKMAFKATYNLLWNWNTVKLFDTKAFISWWYYFFFWDHFSTLAWQRSFKWLSLWYSYCNTL